MSWVVIVAIAVLVLLGVAATIWQSSREKAVRRLEEQRAAARRREEELEAERLHRQDELIRLMNQGQVSLEREAFAEAQKCFQDLVHQGLADGKITDWPHLTETDRRTGHSGLFAPMPHLPTKSDVLLGLAFAAMGLGDLDAARNNLLQSGFYRLLPSNFDERRRLLAELQQQPYGTGDEWFRQVFERLGYEGTPRGAHATWFVPALRALLVHAIRWANEDLCVSQRLRDAFEMMGWIYGFGQGRWAPEEFYQRLPTEAWNWAKHQNYELAVFFMQQMVKHEPPYYLAAVQDIKQWAYGAIEHGLYGEAEKLIVGIQEFPAGEMAELDMALWQSRKQAAVCDIYWQMIARANRKHDAASETLYRQRASEAECRDMQDAQVQ